MIGIMALSMGKGKHRMAVVIEVRAKERAGSGIEPATSDMRLKCFTDELLWTFREKKRVQGGTWRFVFRTNRTSNGTAASVSFSGGRIREKTMKKNLRHLERRKTVYRTEIFLRESNSFLV